MDTDTEEKRDRGRPKGTSSSGGIFKRGSIYYIRLKVGGKDVKRRAGPTKAAAQRLLAELLDQRERGKQGLPKRSFATFEAYARGPYMEHSREAKRRSSIRNDEARLNVILPILGSFRLAELDETKINSFRRSQVDRGCEPSYINRLLALIKAILRYAVETRELAELPYRKIRNEKEKPLRQLRDLTGDEERAIAEALPSYYRWAFRIALATGLRQGELIALKWQDVDFERSVLLIRDSKMFVSRTAPVGKGLLAELRSKMGTPLAPVCPNESTGGPINPRTLLKAFHRAAKAAGRDDLVWHSLRHLCESRLLACGMPFFAVMDVMGHKSTAMSKRYAHFSPEFMGGFLDQVEEKRGGKDG